MTPLQNDFAMFVDNLQTYASMHKIHNPSLYVTPTSKITWVALGALSVSATALSTFFTLPPIAPIALAAFSVCVVAFATYKIFVPSAPLSSATNQAILDGNFSEALNYLTEFETYHGKKANKLHAKEVAKMHFPFFNFEVVKAQIILVSSLLQIDKKPLRKKNYNALLLRLQKITDKNPDALPDYYVTMLNYAQEPHAQPHGLKVKKIKNPEVNAFKYIVVDTVSRQDFWKILKGSAKALGNSKKMETTPKFVRDDLKRLQKSKTMDERNAFVSSLGSQYFDRLDKVIYA